MNNKKVKRLRRKVKQIHFECFRTLQPDNEQDNVSLENISSLMPDQTHVYANGKMNLSFMTDKFVMKWLKQCPEIETYEEMMYYAKHKNLPSKGNN